MMFVVLLAAWVGITYGLCWMAVMAVRGVVRLWVVLLDGAAEEVR